MTKPLHSTTWRTESDCGVQVDVSEGRTTEWVPFREIVVTTDAGMSPAEARRLVADLQHAIALAEEATSEDEDDSEESPVIVIPENPIQRANRQNRAACYAYGRFDADPIQYVPSAQFIALVTERGVDTEGFRNLYNELLAAKTAASADQPTPREETCGAGVEWDDGRRVCELNEGHDGRHKNDDLLWWSDDREQPVASEDQPKPREARRVWVDSQGGIWDGRRDRDVYFRAPEGEAPTWGPWDEINAGEYGPLSEVLADSEEQAS